MITMSDPLADNEEAIRIARLELEGALEDVRLGLEKVDQALELFRRFEEDLAAGRRRWPIEGE